MSAEIPSIAIFEPMPGHETEALSTMRELMSALNSKGYSRDRLLRQVNPQRTAQYVLIRHWASEDSRRQAAEDPELLRFWARLSHLIQIITVYETLEDV